VEDFGETLVDLRDRFLSPLPARVNPKRVFIAALLETFAAMPIRLLKRDYLPSVISHPSVMLPNFIHDLNCIAAEFKALNDRPCTVEQVDQAREVLNAAMYRFHARCIQEQNLWQSAVRAGMFLGVLFSCLLMTSAALCILTNHISANLYMMIAFIILQGIAATVCLNGWHHR